MAGTLTIQLTSETQAALEHFKSTQATLHSNVGTPSYDEAHQRNSVAAVEVAQHVWNDIYRASQSAEFQPCPSMSNATLRDHVSAHFQEAPLLIIVALASLLAMFIGFYIEPFGLLMRWGTAIAIAAVVGLHLSHEAIDARTRRLAAERSRRAYDH